MKNKFNQTLGVWWPSVNWYSLTFPQVFWWKEHGKLWCATLKSKFLPIRSPLRGIYNSFVLCTVRNSIPYFLVISSVLFKLKQIKAINQTLACLFLWVAWAFSNTNLVYLECERCVTTKCNNKNIFFKKWESVAHTICHSWASTLADVIPELSKCCFMLAEV